MKTIRHISWLVVLCLIMTSTFCQQKLIVRLGKDQIDQMKMTNDNGFVNIATNNNRTDNFLNGFRIKRVYQTYPSALEFKHEAAERISRLFTLEFEGGENIHGQFRDSQAFEYVEEVADPIPTYTPNDFALRDQVPQIH